MIWGSFCTHHNFLFQGQATDIAIQAEEILKLKRQINNIYCKHTGQLLETIGTVCVGIIGPIRDRCVMVCLWTFVLVFRGCVGARPIHESHGSSGLRNHRQGAGTSTTRRSRWTRAGPKRTDHVRQPAYQLGTSNFGIYTVRVLSTLFLQTWTVIEVWSEITVWKLEIGVVLALCGPF